MGCRPCTLQYNAAVGSIRLEIHDVDLSLTLEVDSKSPGRDRLAGFSGSIICGANGLSPVRRELSIIPSGSILSRYLTMAARS